MYKVKCKTTKVYGSVICIGEYCINNKWRKLKVSIGNSKEPITDEQLNDFIEKYKPDEINLTIKDKRGDLRHIDFTINDLID